MRMKTDLSAHAELHPFQALYPTVQFPFQELGFRTLRFGSGDVMSVSGTGSSESGSGGGGAGGYVNSRGTG